MDLIQEIRLADVLPKVFEGEGVRESNIWQRDVVFRKGERIIINAESGTGKSSLCAYIFGTRKDYIGHIYFNSADISGFGIDKWQMLRRNHLAYLPQELSLFPELTAFQNIKLKNDLTRHISEAKISEWLRRLGIDHRADFPVGKMSVGQQQRVAVIRALCQPFDFILLDEPVSHLDETNNRIVAEIVAEQAQLNGAGIIATSVGNHLLLDSAQYYEL